MGEVIISNATIDDIVRISSREVAIMMDATHSNLVRKIDNINDDFREINFDFSEMWEESTYKTDGNNKTYKEYLISKEGCEFLAHKTTGTKGNIFTLRYMQKFKEMENQLKNQVPQISEKEQMLLKLFSNNPVEVANAHKRIVEIEVEEATTPLLETIEVQKPKAEFHDTVTQNNTEYDASELAKTLNFKRMGRNNLIGKLREKGVLDSENEMYQTYIDRGYGRVVDTGKLDYFGHPRRKTVYTTKGMMWIKKKLLEWGYEEAKKCN